ncbi:hypothetical protein A6R68_00515 [Neotoma lepida]|uniref:Uncharacterized protein n=1 Tax=Neotoma lepida TaxID=56216 RepID=A0A1A6GY73_NEOLE|nr:hypothetical protein A6R68_00515 [Neotoma lepida]
MDSSLGLRALRRLPGLTTVKVTAEQTSSSWFLLHFATVKYSNQAAMELCVSLAPAPHSPLFTCNRKFLEAAANREGDLKAKTGWKSMGRPRPSKRYSDSNSNFGLSSGIGITGTKA